jgi:hypothetical protein
MNHIYGVNKYTYALYCTETDIFLKKLPELDPDPDLVMKFPDRDPDPTKRSGSDWIRIRNTGWYQSIPMVPIITFGLILTNVIDPSVKDFLYLIDSIDNRSYKHLTNGYQSIGTHSIDN